MWDEIDRERDNIRDTELRELLAYCNDNVADEENGPVYADIAVRLERILNGTA